jgi:polyisoprenoid-binding protein YceI
MTFPSHRSTAMIRTAVLALALAASFGAAAAPVAYKLDPSHTVVLASWSHVGYSHPSANFGHADGTLVYDADDVTKSHVEVTLPLSGLDTFVPKLDEHLRSADFFDAAKYPDIAFKSTMVHDMGGGKLMIMGDLTVHGVTRPVTLDATLNKAGVHPMTKLPAVGFDATTTIKRSDFGVGAYVPMVGDEISIRITTEASAKAAP